jgi:hypothetical protein
MKHFKLLVFDEVKKDICNAILKLIDRERDGDVVDRNLIRECKTKHIILLKYSFNYT